MSDTLQKLSVEYKLFTDELEANGGELTSEEMEEKFDSLPVTLDRKIEGTICHIINKESVVPVIEAEIKRLTQMKKSILNGSDWFRGKLKSCMELVGIREKDFILHKVWIQKNPPSVEIIDEALIPERFIITIPESYKVDKKAVLTELKAGKDIQGARLIDDKTNLRIK